MNAESRQESRVKTDYIVKMTRINSSAHRFINAELINISHGGCKLNTTDIQTGFAVGEPISISFRLADFKIKGPETLKLEAHVRWALPNGSELGCQFKEMDAKSKKLFDLIVDRLIQG